MGKYSEKLLGVKSAPGLKVEPGKYSKILLGGGISEPEKQYIEQPSRTPTGGISTITGQPITELTGHPSYKPASWGALYDAGFVDNNEAKFKIFAKARGIDPSKYESKNGKIWFQGEDGNMYPETPKELDSLIKKLVSELPSEGLPDVGAGVGTALAGVPGAVAGAAGGEFIRKQVGKLKGDKQSVMDYAGDMGLQALFAGFDSTIAKGLMSKLNSRKIKKATGGKLTTGLAEEVGNISDAQRIAGRSVRGKGENIGVDVMPHQAMDDPTLTGFYSMLRDNPKTARQVRKIDDKLENQVENASRDLVLEISPNETDAHEVGSRLSAAGDEVLKKMRKERSDLAGPSYDAAYASGVEVDTQPVVDEIARLKNQTKPGMKAHNALVRIEKMLFKKNDKDELIPETDIQILDNVKQEIDGLLSGKNASSITNKMKRKLMKVKDQLTTQTDAVSPDYQKARELFAGASPKITKTENSIIGALAGMKTENVKETAIKKIFASPRSIRVAKRHIEKQNPELWQDAVAEYFRDSFEKSAKVAQGSGGKVLNRPGKYSSKMWDLSDQRKLKFATEGMKDANGQPLYERIEDFFVVMQKASIGQGKESATQPRQKMVKELQGLPGQLSASVTFFRQTLASFFLRGQQDRVFDRNAKRLLDLMQTQEGVELIAKAKAYGPRTDKGVRAATTLILMATQTNVEKANEAIQTLGQ